MYLQSAAADTDNAPAESIEAIIGELERARAPDFEGYSAYEISERLGRSETWVHKRLKRLHTAGRLVIGKRRSLAMDGKVCWTPVFRLRKS